MDYAGLGETALSIGSSVVAEPLAGLGGLFALTSGAGLDRSAKAVDSIRNKLTYNPKTEQGQENMQNIGQVLEPLAEGMEYVSSGAGDFVYDKTGSEELATAAYTAPTAALDLVSFKTLSPFLKAGRNISFGDIPQGIGNQRGVIAPKIQEAARSELARRGIDPDQPKGNKLLSTSEKLEFIKSEDGRVYMKANIASMEGKGWQDVTDSVAGQNALKKHNELERYGSPEAAADAKRQKVEEMRRAAEAAEEADTYKMQHTAPTLADNPSALDLSDSFPDIYTGNALRYYGTGSDYDAKAITAIHKMKDNPNAEVTIYRAVPEDVADINASDWVTTTKEYALDHIGDEQGWHIISKKVKPSELANDGNSIHEFGYNPVE